MAPTSDQVCRISPRGRHRRFPNWRDRSKAGTVRFRALAAVAVSDSSAPLSAVRRDRSNGRNAPKGIVGTARSAHPCSVIPLSERRRLGPALAQFQHLFAAAAYLGGTLPRCGWNREPAVEKVHAVVEVQPSVLADPPPSHSTRNYRRGSRAVHRLDQIALHRSRLVFSGGERDDDLERAVSRACDRAGCRGAWRFRA